MLARDKLERAIVARAVGTVQGALGTSGAALVAAHAAPDAQQAAAASRDADHRKGVGRAGLLVDPITEALARSTLEFLGRE